MYAKIGDTGLIEMLTIICYNNNGLSCITFNTLFYIPEKFNTFEFPFQIF